MSTETTMKNPHFSFTKEDQENMSPAKSSHPQAVLRIHAFSRTTNKANGPECSQWEAPRFVLHGSGLGPEEAILNMKDVSEQQQPPEIVVSTTATPQKVDSGLRERLKRHREEMAGHVSIPDKWGQEELLKDWIDCSSFEALLVPNKIASARKALVADHGRRRAASQLGIESRC